MILSKIAEAISEHEYLRLLIAGGAGGIVRWMTLREDWKSGLASVSVGSLSAVYLSPLAEKFLVSKLGIPVATEGAGLTGFLIGLTGMAVSGFIIDTAKKYRARSASESRKEFENEE